MPLISCPDCKHKVSTDAKICPQCNHPIPVYSNRKCENCKELLPKNKRKCPSCGHSPSKPTSRKSKEMSDKKNSSILSIFVIAIIAIGAYFYLNTSEAEKEEITNGIYYLTETRTLESAACNLSAMHFGKWIRVEGDRAYTNLINEVSYDIVSIGNNSYNIGPASVSCYAYGNQLIFNCQGREIIFQRN